VYSKRGVTGSSQRANDPLTGHPVTKLKQLEQSPVQYMKLRIITKTHKRHQKPDTNQKHTQFIFTPSIVLIFLH